MDFPPQFIGVFARRYARRMAGMDFLITQHSMVRFPPVVDNAPANR